ncbi:hypothetical protein [Actinophytocola sediminis]
MTTTAVPDGDAELAADRARSTLNYLATLVAFAHHHGVSDAELVDWLHGHYEELGYYAEWRARNGSGNTAAFVADFVRGRRLLYAHSTARERPGEDCWEITTPIWFRADPTEAFFFLGLEPVEFSAYVAVLTRAHAARLGLDVEIEHDDRTERVVVRKAVSLRGEGP